MQGFGSSLRIPNFITAQSPMGLRRLMLSNNVKNGKEYVYFDIQFANGKWFAWYLEVEDENSELVEKPKVKND